MNVARYMRLSKKQRHITFRASLAAARANRMNLADLTESDGTANSRQKLSSSAFEIVPAIFDGSPAKAGLWSCQADRAQPQ